MNKTITILVLFVSSLVFAQQKIETLTLTNGKSITIYDDYTWHYSDINSTSVNNLYDSNSSAKSKSSKKSKLSTRNKSNYNNKSYSSGYCGARNKTGGYCKRKVKGGGYCWQHR